jgi:hypothetical protein
MSTRSVIIVTGQGQYGQETYRLYKHSDGYPSGNLPIIESAIRSAKKQCEVNNARFKPPFIDDKTITPNQLVGHLIGAATSVYGMGATVEFHAQEEFKPEHLGNQWDVEYVYIVDLALQQVRIYAGSFKDGIQAGYAKGTIDVLDTEDKKDKKRIQKAVNRLIDIGYGPTIGGIVPPKFKRPRKAKQTCKIDMVICAK